MWAVIGGFGCLRRYSQRSSAGQVAESSEVPNVPDACSEGRSKTSNSIEIRGRSL